MNFYEILGVPNTATKYEIKKAYHKLAIQFHPDKCPNSVDKFNDIKTAYDVLSDDAKRAHYDSMTNEEQHKMYDLIKTYFKDIRPEYSHVYDMIIDMLYSKNEDEFKTDINDMNIKNIFDKIKQKIVNSRYIEITTNNIDLHIKLKERYYGVTKKVKIGNNTYDVNLWKKVCIIENTDIGQVTINIICLDDNMYQQIGENDLLVIQPVSLSQYLYGSKIKVDLFGNTTIPLEFDSCLDKKPIFGKENRGFIYDDGINRGKLFVYIVIEGINWVNNNTELDITYAETTKETIKLMFPPIYT